MLFSYKPIIPKINRMENCVYRPSDRVETLI